MESRTTAQETTTQAPGEILQLGDPRLRWPSKAVPDARAAGVRVVLARLHLALGAFRAQHGFGRAMAAPQLGVRLRLVAFDLGRGPRALINPRITARSEASFTLWDDCLCFPDVLVRVRRARSITIAFEDERGHEQTWRDLAPAEAELFQHELDHLDGVLAVDRAVDAESLVTRGEFERERERFEALVDGPKA
ncbi:MAG: peptide deformylase [Planctomycetes bacterium]|nr:peptide deformylase [Planctomycetota bacterium]